jgi:hypothetical protein
VPLQPWVAQGAQGWTAHARLTARGRCDCQRLMTLYSRRSLSQPAGSDCGGHFLVQPSLHKVNDVQW